jgi:hypothetical protein
MVEQYLHSPYVFMVRCLIRHSDNFTFTAPLFSCQLEEHLLLCEEIEINNQLFLATDPEVQGSIPGAT